MKNAIIFTKMEWQYFIKFAYSISLVHSKHFST